MSDMDDGVITGLMRLQYDLENSLCRLAKKYSILSKKLTNSTNVDMKDKLKVSDIGQRRMSISDCKPYKKTKLSSEKTQKSSFPARAKTKRTQHIIYVLRIATERVAVKLLMGHFESWQPAKSQENGFPEKSSDIPKVQKNDTLNRFWAFFDCYCADITTEDINVLERWIESHERDSECQNIPDLGVHYSSTWMEEKILEEMKEGSKSMANPKGIESLTEESNSQLELLRKKTEEKINDFSDLEQPSLFEKLMLSLVQENIITSNDMSESILDDEVKEMERNEESKPTLKFKENNLENRLRLQLAELGVIETDFSETFDDELLQELKRLQSLLIPISELNVRKKKALLSRAKAEIAKQEAQKRIQEADVKVMESYRTMSGARLKGKKLGKKELSQIRSILEERDRLMRNTKIDS